MSEEITIYSEESNKPFSSEEEKQICSKIKKCIDNMNELKQINEQQKEIRLRTKQIRDENKELFNDIIEFAGNIPIQEIKLSNGFVIKIIDKEKITPYSEDMIKTGIIKQLKQINDKNAIEKIGYNKYVDGIIENINKERNKTNEHTTSLRFVKPKKNDLSNNKKPRKSKKSKE